MSEPTIAAVTVNHNTSLYTELLLRSLFATQQQPLNLSLTVIDNNSEDLIDELYDYTNERQIPIQPSGFTTATKNNSHGEILRRFVLDTPNCTHYLFLDSDVCFLEENTVSMMLEELEQQPDLFGIGPRMSWDGLNEIPPEVRQNNPDIQDARLHPCCALVKNSTLFRDVVETIGLSAHKYLWAERDEYLDTFKLMTRVMNTHGFKHGLSVAMVMHFFTVSYDWDDEKTRRSKAEHRDERLQKLREAAVG